MIPRASTSPSSVRAELEDRRLSSVSGGRGNTASGGFSSVSGGNNRSAPNTYNWRAGSLSEAN